MPNVEAKLLQRYGELNPTEQKIADFFLAHRDQLFHTPIAQLAAASGVSQAAWVRFAKSLGFDGLKALKRSLFEEHRASPQKPLVFADIKDFPDTPSLLWAIKSSSVKAIEDTFQTLDAAVVNGVADRILRAQTLRLFGVGASAMVAEDFLHKMIRIGMNALFHYDTHLQLSYAANSGPKDVAFFVSHSGATREVLEMQETAKAAGAFTISLTRLEGNPLARRTDLQLYTKAPEVLYRSGAMSSRMAQLFVIDVLYTAIANRNYEQVAERLQKSSQSVSAHRLPSQEPGPRR
ncbi:MAG: MurR/RpiR family transcriptional regulator [Candidatus Limiplasma sp.]|nr:MurR/RpiR family transcriptional regulator [Candidatus Limiplasma sp.]